jgi:hypothetical protein
MKPSPVKRNSSHTFPRAVPGLCNGGCGESGLSEHISERQSG